MEHVINKTRLLKIMYFAHVIVMLLKQLNISIFQYKIIKFITHVKIQVK